MGVRRRDPLLDSKVGDGTGPEDRADNGCVVGQALVVSFEPVEPRADQTLDARRHRQLARVLALPTLGVDETAVAQHPHRFLEEERVPARVSYQRRREPRLGQRRVAEEVGEQCRRLFAVEGVELDRPPPALRAQEPWRRLGELGPRRADNCEG